jgi:hypothetical protein
MLADPQSVTINSVATPLAKTQSNPGTNTYTSVDGLTSMVTRQTTTRERFRREVRLSQNKIAADPISALNKSVGVSVYLVIDEPRYGFSDAEIGYLIDALKTWSSSTNYNKVLVGEF